MLYTLCALLLQEVPTSFDWLQSTRTTTTNTDQTPID